MSPLPFAAGCARLRASTLSRLEARFGACFPASLFPKAATGPNSRERLYSNWTTFWCLLWQALQPGASSREVVRPCQALAALQGGPRPAAATGAFCRARARLPAHNLVRCTLAHAAATYRLDLDRLSFKGALDTLRHFNSAFASARSHAHRLALWDALLLSLAADLVPLRPGRREPRALKHLHRKYPPLRLPRSRCLDRPKRNRRRSLSLLRSRLK